MKKLNLSLLVLAGLTSCSNPIETALKNDIKGSAIEAASSYKLVKYEITDTVTVADRIKMLEEKLPILRLASDIDFSEFVKMRNQEFKEFRSDTTYEEKIMRGEYKDASPWCTELREVTETADSLLANWEDSKNSWDAKRAYLFYLTRSSQFYDNATYPESWRQSILLEMDNSKPLYDELQSINNAPSDSSLYITLLHTYSLENPKLKKRLELTDSVAMDLQFNIIGKESKTDSFDMLLQVFSK